VLSIILLHFNENLPITAMSKTYLGHLNGDWLTFTIFYIKLKYSFWIYNNMFCNIFSKLFGKKEKNVEKIEDKKIEENA
jgi:hypothetical protein